MNHNLAALINLVEEIKSARKDAQSIDFGEIQNPDETEAVRSRNKLEWAEGRFRLTGGKIDLQSAREKLIEKIMSYAAEKKPGRYLLIPAPPGIGKTHALVEACRRLAKKGERCLVLMPTHEHYHTLAEFPHFEQQNFYHWKAFSAIDPDSPDGDKMCKFEPTMNKWVNKGYRAKDLCNSLCSTSGYIKLCPYRQQSKTKKNNIAAVHEHLVFGLGAEKIKTVIVDEIPIRAFMKPRHIPTDGLRLENAGPIGELAEILHMLASNIQGHDTFSGKALFDICGELFGDALAQFEVVENAKMAIPYIGEPADVENAPWFYIEDLLRLGVIEYEAWTRGIDNWLERIILTKDGLTLLKRGTPWKSLPPRMILLDATGEAETYRQLFNREIEVVNLPVERKGRIYQVVHRLNGKTTINVPDAVRICKAIKITKGYRRVGIVTFKEIREKFEQEFGAENVLHFYGQRGRNDLKGCDGVFIVGTPQPSDASIIKQATTLFSDRVDPFSESRIQERKFYEIANSDGLMACRLISGFGDSRLSAISEISREQELHQALHRGRPLDHDCDTWVFSSIPTPEPLTAIYDKPNEALDCPPDISWSIWATLIIYAYENQGEVISYNSTKYEGTVSVSEIAGVSEKWARTRMIIQKLSEAFPDVFEMVKMKSGGRGRPAVCAKVKESSLREF